MLEGGIGARRGNMVERGFVPEREFFFWGGGEYYWG